MAMTRKHPVATGGRPLLTFLAVAVVACGTQSTPDRASVVERSRTFERAADSGLARGNPASYLANVREAAALRPHHPTLVYHLARAYVMNDSITRGLAMLDRLAAMGIAVRPQRDSGFVRLWHHPAFVSLLERFAANATPTEHSTLAFTLAGERAFLPEGVTLDPRTGTFYVGSVHQQRIVQVQDGIARPFASAEAFWSVMGMAVDTACNLLWAATSSVAEGNDTDSADVGRAAIVALDLTTERVAGGTRHPMTGRDTGLVI
jgi:hypothetical protein